MSLRTLASKHPGTTSLIGVIILLASVDLGRIGVFVVGLPALAVCCGLAAGARSPSNIPAKDALAYIAVSIAIVIGAVLYAIFSH